MAEIKAQYKSAPEEIMEKVAETEAKREMEMSGHDIDMQIGIAEQDVSSLADSFNKQDVSLSERFKNAKEMTEAGKNTNQEHERTAEEECL